MIKKRSLLSVLLIIAMTGCASAPKSSDLYTLYTRSTTQAEPRRNPVIVIPGLLGSKLIDSESGKVVWGAFDGGWADSSKPMGMRLAAIPMKKDVPLKDLVDTVLPSGAVGQFSLRVFLLPIRLNAYLNILKILGVAGYRDEDVAKSGTVKYSSGHFTSFQFDYDWRRDIAENANALEVFVQERRLYVQGEIEKRFGIKNYDVQFDIVAHSMGSLIARYYLKYGGQDLPKDGSLPQLTWAGAKQVERLVMIGPPNAGSIKSLTNLVEGFQGSFVPRYQAAVLGTMPSIYQLLPKTEHRMVVDSTNLEGPALDIFDSNLWEELKWGLASPAQDKYLKILLPEAKTREERESIAIDHLRKCLQRARQIRESLDISVEHPKHLNYYLFAGDAMPTDSIVSVDKKTSQLKVIQQAPGDGSVLRSSALLDDRTGSDWSPRVITPIRWSNVMFLFSNHIGITKDPAFSDNLLYHLLEHPEYDEYRKRVNSPNKSGLLGLKRE
ncbi:MAG: pimeloyl-ACP methyl ester carboxylesterase [Candidatus Omnitrophota bacterium]|jgi:pimeloyl-ACP methyl ester carboxylesterase